MTGVPDLEVRLEVVQADGALDVRATVRNTGASAVDLQSWVSELRVDGVAVQAWAWSLANGLRDDRESALPPGEEVELRRVLPVDDVLPDPGPHDLVVVVRGVASPPVRVDRDARRDT